MVAGVVLPEHIEMGSAGETLIVSGDRRSRTLEPGSRYHLREIVHGTISRMSPVQDDGVEAPHEHGMLSLTLPKVAHSQPGSIAIGARTAAAPAIDLGTE